MDKTSLKGKKKQALQEQTVCSTMPSLDLLLRVQALLGLTVFSNTCKWILCWRHLERDENVPTSVLHTHMCKKRVWLKSAENPVICMHGTYLY